MAGQEDPRTGTHKPGYSTPPGGFRSPDPTAKPGPGGHVHTQTISAEDYRPEVPVIKVNVRWNDGYLEVYEATEVRFGSDLLWMRLINGANRHIPTRQVRWWSTSPESHEER